MADTAIVLAGDRAVPIKLIDNGDGTWSLAVTEQGAGGGGGGGTEYTESDNAPAQYAATLIGFRDVTGTPDTTAIPSDDKPFPVRQEALVRGIDTTGGPLTPIPFTTASGNVTVGTPASGKRYRLHRLEYSYITGPAGTIGHRAGAAGTIVGKRRIPATEGFVAGINLGNDYHDIGVDTALVVNASAATVCEGTAWVEEL